MQLVLNFFQPPTETSIFLIIRYPEDLIKSFLLHRLMQVLKKLPYFVVLNIFTAKTLHIYLKVIYTFSTLALCSSAINNFDKKHTVFLYFK